MLDLRDQLVLILPLLDHKAYKARRDQKALPDQLDHKALRETLEPLDQKVLRETLEQPAQKVLRAIQEPLDQKVQQEPTPRSQDLRDLREM